MTRKKDSSTVTVVYAVERSGEIMTAQNAVTALQVLDDQELAIILRQVVGTKAESKLLSKFVISDVDCGNKAYFKGIYKCLFLDRTK